MNQLRFLYPSNPLDVQKADEPFLAEYSFLKANGASCSLFDFDSLDIEFSPKPGFNKGDSILYRGWMLPVTRYRLLVTQIEVLSASPITSADDYEMCHHLPNWYPLCRDLTPETLFLPFDESLLSKVEALNWREYFVKDYVKSNSDTRGSIANSASEVIEVLKRIETYRGEIEGGVSLRRVEEFIEGTEQRHFVVFGQPHSPGESTPDVVHQVSQIIRCPFYSVDTISRTDGRTRIVELGDGQVSDRKTWDAEQLARVLLKYAG